MRALITGLAVLAIASTASAEILNMPLDGQINIGRTTTQSPSGDALYPAFNSADDTVDWPGAYTRHHLDGGGAANWWYQYVDFYLAGETNNYIDITGKPTLEFDLRIFEDLTTNSNPYGDTAVFVRLYTYSDDPDPVPGDYETYEGHRDYGIVNQINIAANPELQYPNWQNISVDLSTWDSENGNFQPTAVSRMRFYGTNWAGGGDDFRDFANLVLTPEPGTLVLLGLGGLALLRRRR